MPPTPSEMPSALGAMTSSSSDAAMPPPAFLPTRTLVVAGMSTVVEWYDFNLFLYMSTVFADIFYGGGVHGTVTSLAVFALSYLLRPLGGLFFGRLGDRMGRRPVLLASMAVMALATFATAPLPTADQVGPVAGWLLLSARCVTAFSVGGEYTGVMTYLLESAKPSRRGLVVALAASASEIGGLVAVALTTTITMLAGATALQSWAWRLPFVLGGILAVAVLGARSVLPETPEFQGIRPPSICTHNEVAPPRVHPMPAGRRFGAILRTFWISGLCAITYYVGVAYIPTYLVTRRAWRPAAALGVSVAAALVVVIASPLAGWAADRWGRRPVLLILGLLALVTSVPVFESTRLDALVVTLPGVALLAATAGALSAVGACAIPEQFPTRQRLTSLALGGTVATTIFGGLAPLIAQLMSIHAPAIPAPGLMIALIAAAALPAILTSPETAPTTR